MLADFRVCVAGEAGVQKSCGGKAVAPVSSTYRYVSRPAVKMVSGQRGAMSALLPP